MLEGDILLLVVEQYHSFLASSMYVPMRCKGGTNISFVYIPRFLEDIGGD
jgi:hypothetical protein